MGGAYKWPTVEETKKFRAKTKDLINMVIDRVEISLPVKWDGPLVLNNPTLSVYTSGQLLLSIFF
jgi:hypothetical protein